MEGPQEQDDDQLSNLGGLVDQPGLEIPDGLEGPHGLEEGLHGLEEEPLIVVCGHTGPSGPSIGGESSVYSTVLIARKDGNVLTIRPRKVDVFISEMEISERATKIVYRAPSPIPLSDVFHMHMPGVRIDCQDTEDGFRADVVSLYKIDAVHRAGNGITITLQDVQRQENATSLNFRKVGFYGSLFALSTYLGMKLFTEMINF